MVEGWAGGLGGTRARGHRTEQERAGEVADSPSLAGASLTLKWQVLQLPSMPGAGYAPELGWAELALFYFLFFKTGGNGART